MACVDLSLNLMEMKLVFLALCAITLVLGPLDYHFLGCSISSTVTFPPYQQS